MTATTPEERAELARLASDMATTPGPWVVPDADDEYVGPADVVSDGVPGERWIICEHAGADARYIAAADPDTIRRLLADLDAAEERAFNAENIARLAEESEAGWRREADELAERLAAVTRLCHTVIGAHEQVVMDTPEDRDLHDRAIATFRAALTTTPTPAAEVGRREESGR